MAAREMETKKLIAGAMQILKDRGIRGVRHVSIDLKKSKGDAAVKYQFEFWTCKPASLDPATLADVIFRYLFSSQVDPGEFVVVLDTGETAPVVEIDHDAQEFWVLEKSGEKRSLRFGSMGIAWRRT